MNAEDVKRSGVKLAEEVEKIDAGIPAPRTPISFAKLEEIIEKWLLIKDKGLIKVTVATVIANRLPTDPVWLFIVAASGGTKTEMIRGLEKVDGMYSISDLTPQTFLSGEKSTKKASLLLRLPSEVILTYKDFTTVLTMHQDKKHAIMAQLREIYDGYYKKEFGTGETKEWKGKLGFIAGVTTVVDKHQSLFSTLGERFIQYRPKQPGKIEVAKKAMANSSGEKRMRDEIQDAFADFIASVKIPEEKIEVSEEIKDRIAHLATFCVMARSGVIRDGSSNREIELIPDSEMPTRLAKQLVTLYCALSLISGGFIEEDYELIYKIGLDSLPKTRRLVLENLIAASDYKETAEVATAIDYPTNTTRRVLEDLAGLGVVKRDHQGQGHADKWLISEEIRMYLKKALPESQKEKPIEDYF